MKRLFYLLLLLCTSVGINAQSVIKGRIIAEDTKQPLKDALITIENTKHSMLTDANGRFRFTKIKVSSNNTVVVQIQADGYKTLLKGVKENDKIINLGEIVIGRVPINATDGLNEAIQTITLDDADALNESASDQNVSSQLGGAKDLFNSLTSYNWSAIRYRQRGYLNNYNEQYFNGVPFNELDDERVVFNAYGGLNDVTRNQQQYVGLEPSNFAFGDLAGAFNIDTRASVQRAQTKVSYMNTNRNYSHRLMVTHSSGMNQKGWAYSFSGSKRWAQEAYVPGTFMDAYAYFASVDKKFNNRHTLNLTFFGAPIKQGRSGPAIEEMFNLADSYYYNPYWGYQNGEKRNARVRTTHSPTLILRHDFNISNNTSLMTSLSFQHERYSDSNLDWFNAPDPRPDYYSKLPSSADGEAQAATLTDLLKNNEALRQIQWDNFYNINRAGYVSLDNVYNNGKANQSIAGNRAKYVLYDWHSDSREVNLNTNLQHQFSDHSQFAGGAALRYYKGEDFKQLKDLLGADFFLDVDQFALRNFPNNASFSQNDIRTPNRVVKVGDKYGFDYNIDVRSAFTWGQWSYSTSKFDYFVAAKGTVTSFWRTGLAQNGRFPDNSLGKSEVANFFNYGTKGGITYKLDGRNYLNVYAGYMTKAPNSRDAFLAPRVRNQLVPNLVSEKITTVEGAYNYRSPYFSTSIKAYYTYFKDKIKALNFFSDEDQAFVNYVAQGLDFRHTGIEAAVKAKPLSSLEIYAVGTLSQHLYYSRPTAIATPDNGVLSVQSNINGKTLYLKGFYVPNTPQMAGTIGFRYVGKKYWSVGANFNYFAKRYMDLNFNRRSEYAVSLDAAGADKIVENSDLWNKIIGQTKLPDAYTVNINANKSFKVSKYFLNITAGIDNLLNNHFAMLAFEQWRFNWEDKNVDTFPPKYSYAYGRNYFVLAALSF